MSESGIKCSGDGVEGAAGGGARGQGSPVAAVAEGAVDLSRCVAGGAGYVRPAVAEGRAGGGDGLVVAGAVSITLLVIMELLAVELDDKAVLVVATVTVSPGAVRLLELPLLDRDWQPMGPLDIALVTELQRKMRTTLDATNDRLELLSPPEPLAFLGGQLKLQFVDLSARYALRACR